MKISDIDRFFTALDGLIDMRLHVLITGGAAAMLLGGSRATHDIDFEVKIKIQPKKMHAAWTDLQRALNQAARLTGITPQYSDDIERWSSISLPGKKGRSYRKIGKIALRILDPGLWAIGKLTRCLGSDIEDLVDVFSRIKARPSSLALLWGRALAISPPSPMQSEFKRHVDYFFERYARQLWGRNGSPEDLKKKFIQAARRKRAAIKLEF